MDQKKLRNQQDMVRHIQNTIYYLNQALSDSQDADALLKQIEGLIFEGIKGDNSKKISDSILKTNKLATVKIQGCLDKSESLKRNAREDITKILNEIEAKKKEQEN